MWLRVKLFFVLRHLIASASWEFAIPVKLFPCLFRCMHFSFRPYSGTRFTQMWNVAAVSGVIVEHAQVQFSRKMRIKWVKRFCTASNSCHAFIFAKTMDFTNALNSCDLCIMVKWFSTSTHLHCSADGKSKWVVGYLNSIFHYWHTYSVRTSEPWIMYNGISVNPKIMTRHGSNRYRQIRSCMRSIYIPEQTNNIPNSFLHRIRCLCNILPIAGMWTSPI